MLSGEFFQAQIKLEFTTASDIIGFCFHRSDASGDLSPGAFFYSLADFGGVAYWNK